MNYPTVESEIIRRIAAQLNVDAKTLPDLENKIIREIQRLKDRAAAAPSE